MFLFLLSILVGFALLIWSADKFVDGAASTANHLGMPTLLIGILIVGFGTSAPEMVVSAIAAMDGNPSLALGNGIGSNIVNVSLILGFTALICPIIVKSEIVKKEMPLLLLLTIFLGYFIFDGKLEFYEGLILVSGFFILIGWSVYSGLKNRGDILEHELEEELKEHEMSLNAGIFWLVIGLLILVASSKLLVWGAVGVARDFGVSDLIIGLTIVALGTSLPELAASIAAVKKGEHDIAIGNVVGSNMFNILAVVGIAVVINPIEQVPVEAFNRDWVVMVFLTILLIITAYGFKKSDGRINRYEGGLLLAVYVAYNIYLGYEVLGV